MNEVLELAAMIAYLGGAHEFAAKLLESTTANLIERALDEARSPIPRLAGAIAHIAV